MTSCICETPGEDGGVESVAGADVIAVGSLGVVGEVVPITWVSIMVHHCCLAVVG